MRQIETAKDSKRVVACCLYLSLSVSVCFLPWHPDFPPTAHTGAFGEPTCLECHKGGPLNAPGATLRIEGAPAFWQSDSTYRLTVIMTRDSLTRGGFEIAARFQQGGAAAGALRPFDSLLTTVTRDSVTGIPYLHHTRRGTRIAAGQGRWVVLWTAPHEGPGVVSFDAAGVVSNDDDSNLGDAVYTAHAASRRP